jgi:hypothetical protein
MNEEDKIKHNLCMAGGCENPAIVQCLCGKCLRYCKKHIHLWEDDNFCCKILKEKK